MLWFTLWFMVILKIPVLYLAGVIWWAVKDPPDGHGTGEADVGGGGGWRPRGGRGRIGTPERRGPHGSPTRRPLRAPVGATAERRA